MFERYTETARRAIFFSRYEASQNGSPYIESLHLLLGILRANHRIFIESGVQVSADPVEKECRGSLPPAREKISTSVDLPLSSECKAAVMNAAEQADLDQSKSVSLLHLTLAVMNASDTVAGILKNHGVTPEKLGRGRRSSEAVPLPGPAGAFVEFICDGELIANSSLLLANPLPRVGYEVIFGGEQPDRHKVIALQHYFEERLPSRSTGHTWLTKVVITTERLGSSQRES